MGLMTVRFQNRTGIKDVHYGFNECTSTVIMAYLEFDPQNFPRHVTEHLHIMLNAQNFKIALFTSSFMPFSLILILLSRS